LSGCCPHGVARQVGIAFFPFPPSKSRSAHSCILFCLSP
jgi:hypothetical protein